MYGFGFKRGEENMYLGETPSINEQSALLSFESKGKSDNDEEGGGGSTPGKASSFVRRRRKHKNYHNDDDSYSESRYLQLNNSASPRSESSLSTLRRRRRMKMLASNEGSKSMRSGLSKEKSVMSVLFEGGGGGDRKSSKRKLQTRPLVTPPSILSNQAASTSYSERSTKGSEKDHFSPERPPLKKANTHSFVYTMLNPRSRAWQAVAFKRFITFVILIDLLLFIISTEPKFQHSSENSSKHKFFYITEGITSTIFLIEYILRLITCVESRKYGNCRNHHSHSHGDVSINPSYYTSWESMTGRFRYMISANAIIDAVATFPFYVELMTGYDLPTLTYVRTLRLLRITKTEGYSKAMDTIFRVLYYNRQILYVAGLMCVILVLITGVLMYYLRPPPDAPGVDTGDFESIPSTMYLATLVLTGQGGPNGDLPWYTKAVVLTTGVFSVAMFAIPASMLTWGFEAEAERLAAKAKRKHTKKLQRMQRRAEAEAAGEALTEEDLLSLSSASSESSSWFSASSDDDSSSSSSVSSDEEYFNIISGAGGDEVEPAASTPVAASSLAACNDTSLVTALKDIFSSNSGEEEISGASSALSKHTLLSTIAATTSQMTNSSSVTASGAATTVLMENLQGRMDRLESKMDQLTSQLDRLVSQLGGADGGKR